jgi:hypothetical protein
MSSDFVHYSVSAIHRELDISAGVDLAVECSIRTSQRESLAYCFASSGSWAPRGCCSTSTMGVDANRGQIAAHESVALAA